MRKPAIAGVAIVLALGIAVPAAWSATTTQTYDTNTLAGKVASVRGTAGLQVRMSAFLEEEAEPDTPAGVLGPDGVTLVEPGGNPAPLLQAVDAALNGLIASDKFCWTRYGQLRLAWWRRPLRLRADRRV